jgi:hypothetical protein
LRGTHEVEAGCLRLIEADLVGTASQPEDVQLARVGDDCLAGADAQHHVVEVAGRRGVGALSVGHHLLTQPAQGSGK